jgi:hypothetical protein
MSAAAMLVGAVFVFGRDDPNPCEVLSERQLMASVSDHGTAGGRPLLEAVTFALTRAGVEADIGIGDLDPVVRGDRNVVHVGVRGYWIVLATAPGGYVTVTEPRSCSIL